MDTDSLIVHINTEDISVDIAKDIEERSDASNYKLERPLPRVKNQKVIVLMSNELDGKIMIEFVRNHERTQSKMTANS